MILDLKKTSKTPADKFEAIDLLIQAQQDITEVWFIMDSLLQNEGITIDHSTTIRIKEWLTKFSKND